MAHKAKQAAQVAIEKAEATREAAEEVSNKLEALDMKTFITGRFRRQDSSTTATFYPAPVNCVDLKSTMTNLTNTMDLAAPDYNPAEATNILAILISVDPTTLSPGCSSSDLLELSNAKSAAKENADAVVMTQTNFIAAKTSQLNALVMLIQALNQQQTSAPGGTTIAQGNADHHPLPTNREPSTTSATTVPETSTEVEQESAGTTSVPGNTATTVPTTSSKGENIFLIKNSKHTTSPP